MRAPTPPFEFVLRSSKSEEVDMPRRIEARTRVNIEVELLWRTFAEEYSVSWPKVSPEIVTNVEILQGDGGLGSLIFLQFKPGGPTVAYQKTKIVECDKEKDQLGLQVLEGGHLSNGFTKYETYFKLTPLDDSNTLVDVAVECEPLMSSEEKEAAGEEELKAKTTNFPLLFFERLEAYLNKHAAAG